MRAVLAALVLAVAAPVLASDPKVVRIDGPITSETADAVEAAVAAGPVARVVINSPGGSVFDGLRIIRALRKAPAQCEVEDFAASMAAVILESPACSRRVVEKSSIVMFHEGAIGVMGSMKEGSAGSISAAHHALNRALAALVAPRLDLSLDEYLARTTGDHEMWVAGVDALSLHVADEVR